MKTNISMILFTLAVLVSFSSCASDDGVVIIRSDFSADQNQSGSGSGASILFVDKTADEIAEEANLTQYDE